MPRGDDLGAEFDRGRTSHAGAPTKPFIITNPVDLAERPLVDREWIVKDWLPVPAVSAFFANGGIGKTQLAQQLMTSCATGFPWCGLDVMRCRSLGLFCEDDEDELHRRQHRINQAYGVGYDELGDMRWISAVGEDNALIRFEYDGTPVLTPRFTELTEAVLAFAPKLIVLDPAADLFSGNENDRQQVRSFIGFALTKLAREAGAAILLNAHPSRSGMRADGDMDGGSTAWSNSVRSRWAMVNPPAQEENAADPDLRILSRRKANYASADEELKIKWRNGVFMPERQSIATPFGSAFAKVSTEGLFLKLLAACEAANMAVSASNRASNFAPKVFAKRPDAGGHTAKQFDAAMSRLFADKRIVNVDYGRKSDARQRIAVTGQHAADTEQAFEEAILDA